MDNSKAVAVRDLMADPQVGPGLALLIARHRAANGLGMQVLSLVGGSAENLLERLPDSVKIKLESATRMALERAFDAASASRRTVADQPDWLTRAVATAMGAAGGVGGLPTALAELPVTVTVLLRAIQGIAAEHGLDPNDPVVRLECLRVFASAGPLEEDDGAELGFMAARVTITGQTVQTLIAKIAPKLSVVLGQKLAAQAAPVIGAVAGAGVNYVFTSYYQEMARVQFGLGRLALETGVDRAALVAEVRAQLAPPKKLT